MTNFSIMGRRKSHISLPFIHEYPHSAPRSFRTSAITSLIILLLFASILLNAFYIGTCRFDDHQPEPLLFSKDRDAASNNGAKINREVVPLNKGAGADGAVKEGPNMDASPMSGEDTMDPSAAQVSHPDLLSDPIPTPPFPHLRDLVIVAGHAVYSAHQFDIDSIRADRSWVLEEFQKGGQVSTFLEHIKAGSNLAVKNEEALLVFSGGQTRKRAGMRSEAQSYYEIAHALGYLPSEPSNLSDTPASPFSRAATEEYARDSYENLLFSLCRFYELTGMFPRSVTMVSFDFKRQRFVDLHRRALRFPLERFTYVGIDPERGTLGRVMGEKANSLGPFQEDLYGCHGRLREKKLTRNPFRRSHPYRHSCPSLVSLMTWCPENQAEVFPGPLPWD
ncbi:uncharacterized protein VTP21DRAFT_1161 [Calcarisporiella thermophila]|uniref:uncharacterized protein n=1 Tax=Calcarisporiella thermophila TaxID=911321 RepID=UPI003743A06D